MNNLIIRFKTNFMKIQKIEENLINNFAPLFFPLSHQLNYIPNYIPIEENVEGNGTFDDHILWGVPKHRRTVEKRRSRRIGAERWVLKLLPVKKLITCQTCNGPHEVGRLCPTCYSKVKEVTDKIKEAMLKAQGLDPVEHEYVPVFHGEKVEADENFSQGMRIIEIPEQRPSWFSKKLTQKSNVSTSDEPTLAFPNPLHIKK